MSLTDPHAGYGIVPRRKNTYPRSNDDFLDLPKLIADFVLDQNSRPGYGAGAKFFLQGSCFAENLYNELKLAHPCYYNAVIEALNSPLANLHYFSSLVQHPGEQVCQELAKATVFVLTIGVAPCWFRKGSGEFVMGPDQRHMDLFEQRTLSVKESTEALTGVLDLIYRISPRIEIVVTLSPVPLARTFEFDSAIVADCVSKCTLRAAIHEAILGYPGRKPAYFPAFEIVRWVGAHAANAYGDDGLPRHVSKEYVKHIIASFLEPSA
jgi:GSCFA family protein